MRWKVNLRAVRDNSDVLGEATVLKRLVGKPAPFMGGERSDYNPDEDEAGIGRMYPCAEIVTVEGAGLWVHMHARGRFINIILNLWFNLTGLSFWNPRGVTGITQIPSAR